MRFQNFFQILYRNPAIMIANRNLDCTFLAVPFFLLFFLFFRYIFLFFLFSLLFTSFTGIGVGSSAPALLFRCLFGPIFARFLTPTCLPKSTKIAQKSMPRCLPMMRSFFDRCLIDFGTLLPSPEAQSELAG